MSYFSLTDLRTPFEFRKLSLFVCVVCVKFRYSMLQTPLECYARVEFAWKSCVVSQKYFAWVLCLATSSLSELDIWYWNGFSLIISLVEFFGIIQLHRWRWTIHRWIAGFSRCILFSCFVRICVKKIINCFRMASLEYFPSRWVIVWVRHLYWNRLSIIISFVSCFTRRLMIGSLTLLHRRYWTIHRRFAEFSWCIVFVLFVPFSTARLLGESDLRCHVARTRFCEGHLFANLWMRVLDVCTVQTVEV